MGSLYMREEYGKGEGGAEYAAPREIGKIIRCYDEWTGHKGQPVTEYSFLSEFAHPNMGAFSHYYEMKKDAAGNAQVEFSTKFSEEPFPDVSIAVVSALNFTLKLLKETAEHKIAPQLEAILVEMYLPLNEN
ncbi:MAG: hypothetical protein L0338_35840 [Acidobacteria bacterium]|nr:hypothetical protein [Acidobacteriota bacterium]